MVVDQRKNVQSCRVSLGKSGIGLALLRVVVRQQSFRGCACSPAKITKFFPKSPHIFIHDSVLMNQTSCCPLLGDLKKTQSNFNPIIDSAACQTRLCGCGASFCPCRLLSEAAAPSCQSKGLYITIGEHTARNSEQRKLSVVLNLQTELFFNFGSL